MAPSGIALAHAIGSGLGGAGSFPSSFLKGRAAPKPLEVIGAVPLSVDKPLYVSNRKFF